MKHSSNNLKIPESDKDRITSFAQCGSIFRPILVNHDKFLRTKEAKRKAAERVALLGM